MRGKKHLRMARRPRPASPLAPAVLYAAEALERRVMLNAVSFNLPPEYGTGVYPCSGVGTDLNGDGKVDIAVANCH